MKNKIYLVIFTFLTFYFNMKSSELLAGITVNPNDSITIACSQNLYQLTSKLAAEYENLNPNQKIAVRNLPENKNLDLLHSGASINIVSNEYLMSVDNESAWKMVIGRDVIVPIVNSQNPFLAEINQKGISVDAFTKTLKNQDQQKWGFLLKNGQNVTVNYYAVDDEFLKSGLASYLSNAKENINVHLLKTGNEVIAATQKDVYSIGFCKMNDIMDSKNQDLVANINLLPIDRNGNGKLDYSEKIYENANTLTRGIWIGKYPKALYQNIYLVAANQPTNEKEIAFLKWVVTDGQQYLCNNGFTELVNSERQSRMEALNSTPSNPINSVNVPLPTQSVFIILSVILLAIIGLSILFRILFSEKKITFHSEPSPDKAFNYNSMRIPEGLYYDISHTWALRELDGVVRIGIDDFMQHITGPITNVGMKNSGDKVKKGEPLFTIIQKGKKLIINAPFSGTIIKNNSALISNPSVINSQPYTDGWVYTIEPNFWLRDTQFLFMAEKYGEWLKSEFTRLKDFLAASIAPNSLAFAPIVLQDGGELKDNTLEDLDPQVWEDFQTKFINTAK